MFYDATFIRKSYGVLNDVINWENITNFITNETLVMIKIF